MSWGEERSSWDDLGGSTPGALLAGQVVAIELVGTHLRVNGSVGLGRFGRLSDYINGSQGYVRVQNARLLRRNGDPTNLVLPELMVDQDEITFIAQIDLEDIGLTRPTLVQEPADGQPDGNGGPNAAHPLDPGPLAPRVPNGDIWKGGGNLDRPDRQFVLFTPGHTVSGFIKVFSGTDIAGFVDTRDPRFVPMNDVTARSLADRRVISHFKFALINRTHMIAAAEIGRGGDVAHEDLPQL